MRMRAGAADSCSYLAGGHAFGRPWRHTATTAITFTGSGQAKTIGGQVQTPEWASNLNGRTSKSDVWAAKKTGGYGKR